MGIVFVLLIYAVVLTAIASIGAAAFGGITYALTKRSKRRRKRAIVASALFPFVCLFFAGAWFGAYATVNYLVFQRDPGLGDTRETPLPNGYALIMIDTTDHGTVYNPKTQAGDGSISSRDDAVFGVRQLQVSRSLIFGASDKDYFGRIGQESTDVDAYFELDTKLNKVTEFQSLEELRNRASLDGVRLQLQPFNSVFNQFRMTWFD